MCFIVSQIFYGYFIHFKVIKASFMLHIEHKVTHPQIYQKREHTSCVGKLYALVEYIFMCIVISHK